MTSFSLKKNYSQWFRQNIAGGISLLSLPFMWHITNEMINNPEVFSGIVERSSPLVTGFLTIYALFFLLKLLHLCFKPAKIPVHWNESSFFIGDLVLSFELCKEVLLETHDQSSLLLSRVTWYNKVGKLKCSPEGYSASIRAEELENLLRNKVQVTVKPEQPFFRGQ